MKLNIKIKAIKLAIHSILKAFKAYKNWVKVNIALNKYILIHYYLDYS